MYTTNKKNNSIVKETFHGYIENTRDSLLLFEACKRGIIPRITRRLRDRDRHLIRSGSIFCFDEQESGIKRWTDGLIWSPSRILGNFLIYREMDDKKIARTTTSVTDDYGIMQGGAKNIDNEILRSRISSLCSTSTTTTASNNSYMAASDILRKQREKALVGSLKNSSKFKRNGLIKKSMSLIVDGVQQHIISYYSKEDVLSNRLITPSSIVELASLEVSPGLRLRQNFRIPIFLSEDTSDDSFMEEYHSGVKRKYSNITQSPAFESSSSSSSFSSSSSCESTGTGHFLSSLDSQQQHPQFFNSPSLIIDVVPNDLYSTITQAKNNSYHTAKTNNINTAHHISTSYVNNLINSNDDQIIQDEPNDTNVSVYPAQNKINISEYTDKNTIIPQPLIPPFKNTSIKKMQSYQQKEADLAAALMMASCMSLENKAIEQISDIVENSHDMSFDKKPSKSCNNNNITTAKSFCNINHDKVSNTTPTSYNSSTSSGISMNFAEPATIENYINPRGSYYSPAYFDDYHQGQNPHQHLFSSSSFHTINHAAIPYRTEIATNSFMTDMNILLGTGWNEFELQM